METVTTQCIADNIPDNNTMTFSDVFSDDVTNPGSLMWLKTNYSVLQYSVVPDFAPTTTFPEPPAAPQASSASDIYAAQRQVQQDFKTVQKNPMNFLGATVRNVKFTIRFERYI